MGQRISGKNVEVTLSNIGKIVLIDEINFSLSSGSGAAKSGGAPIGWLEGEVEGTGTMIIEDSELDKFLEEADDAGSWAQMEAPDVTLYANVGGRERKIEAFGCKLDFPSFEVKRNEKGEFVHTIPFEVSGEEFVHINGVRLARAPA